MPTYEYHCDKCGENFEEFQGINDEPLTVCPKCKGKVHRLISAGAGLIFKGHGFYITDYRKPSYKKDAAAEKSDVHSGSSSSSTTSKAS